MIELKRDIDVFDEHGLVHSNEYCVDRIYWDGEFVGVVGKHPGAGVALFKELSESACGELGRVLQARDGILYADRQLHCPRSVTCPWNHDS